jgi:glycosyltransferase involved in cell wall biosynthesis
LPDYFSGGVKMMYRHIELLNRHGYRAFALHTRKGFRLTHFAHQVPVVYWNTSLIQSDDIVVMPEYLGVWVNHNRSTAGLWGRLKKRFSKNRYRYLAYDLFHGPWAKVIYNQNPYYTFMGYPVTPHRLSNPYDLTSCLGTICVSEENFRYLKFAFPERAVYRIFYAIDATRFQPQSPKKQMIAYLSFKNRQDVTQVISLLGSRNKLRGFELTCVEGPEEVVAKAFGEASVMLNFGNIEGFGLPPAEAMLSGCVVVGYHGEAGREFMNPTTCFPIENGNIVSFVETVERVVAELSENSLAFSSMRERARTFIRETYSHRAEEESVMTAWAALIAAHQLQKKTSGVESTE